MILNFKQPRLYVCLYMGDKGAQDIRSFKFVPGDNKIPNAEAKFLLKHPGIKNRLDLGVLVEKKSMTEDLAKEAKESKSSENHNAKEAKKAKEAAK